MTDPEVITITSESTAADHALVDPVIALAAAHKTFFEYAGLHRAKGTDAGAIKAQRNEILSVMCHNAVVALVERNGWVRTIAAYALNAAHGARLARFEYDNLVALAKKFGCQVTDQHAAFAVSRAITGEIMAERRKQVELFGYTPERDDANPTRLHDEILSRVQSRPHATMRHALVEAAAILVAEIEHLDRTAPKEPTAGETMSDGATYQEASR